MLWSASPGLVSPGQASVMIELSEASQHQRAGDTLHKERRWSVEAGGERGGEKGRHKERGRKREKTLNRFERRG